MITARFDAGQGAHARGEYTREYGDPNEARHDAHELASRFADYVSRDTFMTRIHTDPAQKSPPRLDEIVAVFKCGDENDSQEN
ncbi:hypothetical protein [Paraburkholderia saeva]|uniref:hypothetical protein n=1 Tax=Paraburkholderia saeva TaxID=2777537 RepID=UPI001E460588|nr:hypothetical protein [Paraburkholderia saeva]